MTKRAQKGEREMNRALLNRGIVWLAGLAILLAARRQCTAAAATQPSGTQAALRELDAILATNPSPLDSAAPQRQAFSFKLATASDLTTTTCLTVWNDGGKQSPCVVASSPLGFVYLCANSQLAALLDVNKPGGISLADPARFQFGVSGNIEQRHLDVTLRFQSSGDAQVKLDIGSFLKVIGGSCRAMQFNDNTRMLYLVTDRIIARVRRRMPGSKGYPIEAFGIRSSDGFDLDIYDIRVGADAAAGVSGTIDASRFSHLPGFEAGKPAVAANNLLVPPIGFWNDFANRDAGRAVAKAIGWPASPNAVANRSETQPADKLPSAKEGQIQTLVNLASAVLGEQQQFVLAQPLTEQEGADAEKIFAQRHEALADIAAEMRLDNVELPNGYLDASRLISYSTDLRRALSEEHYIGFAHNMVLKHQYSDAAFHDLCVSYMKGLQAIGLSNSQMADACDAVVDMTFHIETTTWMYRAALINAVKMKQYGGEINDALLTKLRACLTQQQCDQYAEQLRGPAPRAATQPKDTGGL
jgi:hypothetical protein